jgi:TPR repeat protein
MSFDMYEDAAKKNHADAQYTVGLLCEYGRGTSKSSSDAMDWYLKAAGQGNKDACLSVAKLAHSEFGGITNKKIALQW